MAKISDLPFKYRLFMKTYRFRSVDWGAGVSLSKPLAESKIAVVTTAALYREDQTPFDEELKGGDPSYRLISNDTKPSILKLGHRSAAFDPSGVISDPNIALPITPLNELAEEGFIGSVNRQHISFMGSITAPGRMVSRTAPEAAELLIKDSVDLVLLTPV